MTYLLGIDLGTSSVKVALIEADTLCVAANADREYPVHQPQPGFVEQAPEDWWEAIVQATRAVTIGTDPGQVRGIGLSGQMHGLVCLGQDLEPVRPAIIWADTRATDEVEALADFQPSSAATLPGPSAAGFAAASALWLSQHRPDVLERTHTCLLPKDYVRLRLTGLVGTDPSDASSTWLYDIATMEWAPDVVRRCGLRLGQMPPIQPSAEIAGRLTAEAAEELGLAVKTPVVTGSADLPAQALGHGLVDPGTILMTVGTGGQLFSPRLTPQPDPAQRLYQFQHNVPERWYAQAAILAGGLSLRWLRDLLGLRERPDAYAHLSSLAAGVPPGAEGLIFLPYLAGERTPHMDANAAGLFLGLRLHHGPAHLARAVMEGVGFALRECLELVDPEPATIILSGGITRSQVWPQILADILVRPLQITAAEVPRACVGAAILAGLGTGIYRDVADATSRLAGAESVLNPGDAELYARRYEQYRGLYPLMKDEMHRLQSNEQAR